MEIFFTLNKIQDESLSLIKLNSNSKKDVINNDSFYNFRQSFEECENHSNLFISSSPQKLVETHSIDAFPTLFLEFADLDLSNKSELSKFIYKYGFLTHDKGSKIIDDYKQITGTNLLEQGMEWSQDLDLLTSHDLVYSESLSKWVLFQIHIRRLIRYWRIIYCYHNDRFKEDFFIEIKNKNPLIILDESNNYFKYYFSKKSKFVNSDEIKKDLNNSTLEEINVTHYKTKYVENSKISSSEYRISNNELINFINAYLIFELNFLLQNQSYKIKTNIDFKVKKTLLTAYGKPMGTKLIYNSLMGGIIYQLSNSMSLNKQFKRCLECQKWMEYSIQGRSGKKYCDSNCRGSAHRRRESIKLLYDIASLQGNFSLKKHLNNFCKSFNKGRDEFLIWQKEFDDEFKDRQKIKSLLNNIITNILNNLNVFTSTFSIAEHLDLDHDYIKSININEAFKVAISKHKVTAPYMDWDLN